MRLPTFWHKSRDDEKGIDTFENIKFKDGYNNFDTVKKVKNNQEWYNYLVENLTLIPEQQIDYKPLYIKLYAQHYATVYPRKKPERVDQDNISFVRLDRVNYFGIYDNGRIVVGIKDFDNVLGTGYICADEKQKEIIKKVIKENTLNNLNK